MNQYIINKLKEGRLNKNLKQSDVTKLTGIKNTTLSNYENGNTEPDMDTFLRLCELYDLDYAEILGEAYGYKIPALNFDIKKSDISRIEKYHKLDPHGKEVIDFLLDREYDRCTTAKEKPAAIVEFAPRPGDEHLMKYFRSASAGTGVFILGNEATSSISISKADWLPDGDFVINVDGDSMIPLYNDGDKVIVSQSAEVKHGDIGIFIVNGNVYIKEYGQNELISKNPKADNITISEYDNIVCMGKVIGKITGAYEIAND